jgi:hypothetical protein
MEMEVKLHVVLTLTLDGRQPSFHVATALSRKSAHKTGGSACPRASLGGLEKRRETTCF